MLDAPVVAAAPHGAVRAEQCGADRDAALRQPGARLLERDLQHLLGRWHDPTLHGPRDAFPGEARPPKLADHEPGDTAGLDKDASEELRAKDLARLDALQERLYAEGRRSLLVVFQAMDAAGKDGTIEHVMSGLNPQGVRVTSFKQPTRTELAHDWLWRCQLALPARGEIGIFNRSHYEEVIVVRVHPEYLGGQGRPIWEERFDAITGWERHLHASGTRVVKFFLNVSKKEQRERFLARAEEADKNWKFSAGDVAERERWDDYQRRLRAGDPGHEHQGRAVVRDPGRPQVADAHRRGLDPRPPPRGDGPEVPGAERRGARRDRRGGREATRRVTGRSRP